MKLLQQGVALHVCAAFGVLPGLLLACRHAVNVWSSAHIALEDICLALACACRRRQQGDAVTHSQNGQVGVSVSPAESQALFKRYGFETVMPYE
eukprot:scaffold23917_cov23-Tisochrysis_lutea.AAC.1